jgi:hypothetical protein
MVLPDEFEETGKGLPSYHELPKGDTRNVLSIIESTLRELQSCTRSGNHTLMVSDPYAHSAHQFPVLSRHSLAGYDYVISQDGVAWEPSLP